LKLPEHLSRICVPSLIIAGGKEPKAMRESVKDIINELPNAKGILFEGCRHDLPWKASDDFNRTIREWINDENLSSRIVKSIE
jgi:pimeloyl-ACP methyl ester carboxylesterase